MDCHSETVDGTAKGRFGYRAFGFYLASNLPVPGMEPCPNPGLPVVSLDFGTLPPDFDETGYPHLWYRSKSLNPEGVPAVVIRASGDLGAPDTGLRYWLSYSDGTSVFIGEGVSHLWVTWPESSNIEEACTYLLGPAMAVVAQLRGVTCLHGSAVAVDGGIVGFLGPGGSGKSTTATAFARAGYSVASDDLILLGRGESGFTVEPSYPVLRLWPSTVELLFGHQDALPALSPQWAKRGLNLHNPEYLFQGEPLPLKALYVLGERLDDDSAPLLSEFSGAAVLLSLISNSWAHYADSSRILAAQMEMLSAVSRTVPVRRLVAHASADSLPRLIELVTDDVRRLARAPDPEGVY